MEMGPTTEGNATSKSCFISKARDQDHAETTKNIEPRPSPALRRLSLISCHVSASAESPNRNLHTSLCNGIGSGLDNDENERVLLRRPSDNVAHIVLNRPAQRNALSEELLRDLQQKLSTVSADQTAKVLVISARGPAFCSGHDLKEVRGKGIEERDPIIQQQYYDKLFSLCSSVMLQVAELEIPTVCQTHGIATAAGCQLAASCSMVLSAKDCKFGTPGVNIGLFCSTPSVPIVRSVAPKLANLMLFSGEPISADEALKGGLVSKILSSGNAEDGNNSSASNLNELFDYTAGNLHPETLRLAEQIASKSRYTLAFGKRMLKEQEGKDLRTAYKIATDAMVTNMAADSAKVGITSFIDKKKPKWDD